MNAQTKEIQTAPASPPSLLSRMAGRYGVDSGKMLATLKATAFKGEVSNEQMMALLIVAEQHSLNPWTKEIYAFPDRQNGIVPVVGVDGWSRIINEHSQYDGMTFEESDAACTCTIYRKDRKYPTAVTEYLAECKRNTSPWGSHPKRMLRHKAMIQCARLAFGFAGIYDQDEAERIIDVSPERPASTPEPEINDALGITDAEVIEAEPQASAQVTEPAPEIDPNFGTRAVDLIDRYAACNDRDTLDVIEADRAHAWDTINRGDRLRIKNAADTARARVVGR